jgi:hypothetical protein
MVLVLVQKLKDSFKFTSQSEVLYILYQTYLEISFWIKLGVTSQIIEREAVNLH